MQKPIHSLQSVIDRGIEKPFGLHLTMNAPEFFSRKDFIEYVENNPVFTWHQRGDEPGEYSDVIVLVEPCLNGEGSESDMPEDIWTAILDTLKSQFGEEGEGIPAQFRNMHMAVRITNLDQ